MYQLSQNHPDPHQKSRKTLIELNKSSNKPKSLENKGNLEYRDILTLGCWEQKTKTKVTSTRLEAL